MVCPPSSSASYTVSRSKIQCICLGGLDAKEGGIEPSVREKLDEEQAFLDIKAQLSGILVKEGGDDDDEPTYADDMLPSHPLKSLLSYLNHWKMNGMQCCDALEGDPSGKSTASDKPMPLQSLMIEDYELTPGKESLLITYTKELIYIMADYFRDGTACITGAASGIGRATSLAFARDGCRKLVLGDLSCAGLDETRDMILQKYPMAEVVTCVVDVSNVEQVESFHATAIEKFGRIDFTANVAGYAHLQTPSVELKSSEINKSFAVNLKGVFLCEQVQLRQMLKQSPLEGFESRGSIVNVSSLCATIAMPGLTGYSATKGAILGLTRGDALDYGSHQIRVNSVAPGNIITPMLSGVMGEEQMTTMAGIIPLRRLGQPEDVANAVVWLSSPMACYLTGVNLPVDGGLALSTGPF